MEVKVNSKIKILKSFQGWFPLVFASVIFYGFFIAGAVIWLIIQLTGMEATHARQIVLMLGLVLLLLGVYAYLNWLTKALSSYRLAVENENLVVKGISGWKSIDLKLPIRAIQKIHIGETSSMTEKISLNHYAVEDQINARLTFFPKDGKTFKLDFASKAFDNESLFDFLVFIQSKGIDTNISS